MKKFHSKLGEDAFFVKDGSNISGLVVKEQVTESDIYRITRIKILFWMFLLLELFVLNSARDGN